MADLFDSLLNLEEDYHAEGYASGLADGRASGRIEGRLFGFSTGFETYLSLGELHGRQSIWSARLSPSAPAKVQIKGERAEKNIRSLGGILKEVEVRNGDDEVEAFREDEKRAKGKARVLERILGEKVEGLVERGEGRGKGEGEMEDDVRLPPGAGSQI